jgi:four helix bundle protein
MGKGLRLEELDVYNLAMEIANNVWHIVEKWDWFSRKTLGAQIVTAADSIALNIAEGYGRFHYKENKNFCYYSRGSAKETLTAARMAKLRNLINEEEFKVLNQKLERYFQIMYRYIVAIGKSNSDTEKKSDQ